MLASSVKPGKAEPHYCAALERDLRNTEPRAHLGQFLTG